jgi:hypothetical protein
MVQASAMAAPASRPLRLVQLFIKVDVMDESGGPDTTEALQCIVREVRNW